MSLYFITGNRHKFQEIRAIVPDLILLSLDLDEIQTLDPKRVIEHKLSQAADHHEGTFIVEDTLVRLGALNGFPGTLCKWFYESLGAQGVAELVQRYTDHSATFGTTIGYRDQHGNIHYFAGECPGQIVLPSGDKGFGYDPIFIADGQTRTNSQLTPSEKNAISARGIAARKLAAHLANHPAA